MKKRPNLKACEVQVGYTKIKYVWCTRLYTLPVPIKHAPNNYLITDEMYDKAYKMCESAIAYGKHNKWSLFELFLGQLPVTFAFGQCYF